MKNCIFKYFFTYLFCLGNFSFLGATMPDMQTFLSDYYASSEKAKGYSKLLYSMEKNYRDIAIKLLNGGENPNSIPSNFKNATPLMLAVGREDNEIVSLMIQKGADVNLKSLFPPKYLFLPLPPLSIAILENSQLYITQMLCSRGARVLGNDSYPWNNPGDPFSSPIGEALRIGNLQKFKIMSDTLTDEVIQRVDSAYKSLLGYPAYNLQDKQAEEQIEICKHLISRGLSLETKGGSALSAAAITGNIELIHYFCGLGADINFRPSVPSTTGPSPTIQEIPLFAAIIYSFNKKPSQHEPLKILLDLGAEIDFYYLGNNNIDPNQGNSPLGFAMSHKLTETAQTLLFYGADVNYIDGSHKSPLVRAVEANNTEGVKLLLLSGAKLSGPNFFPSKLIEFAYSKGYIEIAQALIEAEATIYD